MNLWLWLMAGAEALVTFVAWALVTLALSLLVF